MAAKMKIQKKAKVTETIQLPSGASCKVENRTIILSKGSVSLSKKMIEPEVSAQVSGDNLLLTSASPGKRGLKTVKAYGAHIRNMFFGLDNEFTYKLEICNVHFPMTVKVEPTRFLINNFLGEKTPRQATILPNVKVDVKGAVITVTSHDRETAGQTSANIEKATKVRNRDRRVFQDGIYITEKAGGKI